MELTESQKNIIIEESKKAYPNECCGLIVETSMDGNIIIPCDNISENPSVSFVIDTEKIKLYDPEKIIGFYHSHKNNPEFSLADIAFSEKLRKICVLYSVDNDKFFSYHPDNALIPYVGRPFFIGALDCFTLTQDYFSRELNIKIPDAVHPERSNHKTWEETSKKYNFKTIIYDFFINNGFVEVKDLKKHDLLLIKMVGRSFVTHMGIYLGDNQLLQHLYEFSEIEPYSNALKRMTSNILRHKTLM
jgi:proteasome lid subunit RPN8/RPN11